MSLLRKETTKRACKNVFVGTKRFLWFILRDPFDLGIHTRKQPHCFMRSLVHGPYLTDWPHGLKYKQTTNRSRFSTRSPHGTSASHFICVTCARSQVANLRANNSRCAETSPRRPSHSGLRLPIEKKAWMRPLVGARSVCNLCVFTEPPIRLVQSGKCALSFERSAQAMRPNGKRRTRNMST